MHKWRGGTGQVVRDNIFHETSPKSVLFLPEAVANQPTGISPRVVLLVAKGTRHF